jgi:hypothetical protein
VVLSESFADILQADTLRSASGMRVTRWRLPEVTSPHLSLFALRAGRLEPVSGARNGSAVLASLTPHSRRLGATLLSKPRIVLDVPYWASLPYSQVAAQGGGRIFVASNLFYPVFVFNHDRRLLDSLTAPPPSWRALRVTVPGEFTNDARGDSAFSRFLESFSMILDMAVLADSVLVVNHGGYQRDQGGVQRVKAMRSDVYVNHTRVATDLPSPGDILAYSRSSIFFLTGGPPGSTWQLVEYRWRGDRQERHRARHVEQEHQVRGRQWAGS